MSIGNNLTNVEFKEKALMKKQYVSLLAVILAASGFLFSCGDKMKKDTGSLEFDNIFLEIHPNQPVTC